MGEQHLLLAVCRGAAALDARGGALHEGADVAEVTAGALRFADRPPTPADAALLATGASPAGWPSLGDDRAPGTRNGLVFGGHWVWRWKDWIDRRFMARCQEPAT